MKGQKIKHGGGIQFTKVNVMLAFYYCVSCLNCVHCFVKHPKLIKWFAVTVAVIEKREQEKLVQNT